MRQVAHLHQISVIVLATGGEPSLRSTLAGLGDSASPVVVIDCVDVGPLPERDRDAILDAHRGLEKDRRRLIVVNAAAEDIGILAKNGLELAETIDHVFRDAPADTD
ncbi:MAG: hypothetical protein JO214_10985 [Frankiaceae bacterium]|nr:hypothetical protein [Frankiaceae bacterium]